MIESLWKILPGPWWVKALILIFAVAVIAWVVWVYVYPLMGEWLLPTEDAPLLE